MSKLLLISLCNKENLGIKYISSFVKNAGHQSTILYLKEYFRGTMREIKKRYKNLSYKYADLQPFLHRMVNQKGEEEVLGYNSPISEKEKELFISLIEKISPEFIGISVTTSVKANVINLTKIIKEKFNIPVVWGGIEPTLNPDECIKFADIICRGEGEEAMLELLEDKDIYKIKNLWINKNKIIIKNEIRPLIQNLDIIPFPDIEPTYFIENNQLKIIKNKEIYQIISTRGCPFACTYCCNSALHKIYGGERFLRRRSVENVIDELKIAKKKLNIKFVEFYDDVFTFNRKWIENFAYLYKKEINLPFWCFTHPLLADKKIYELLKYAGIDFIVVGVQSGSPYILKIYNRKTTRENIINCAKLLKELGINYYIDIITNNPLESELDCKETLNLLLSLPHPVRLNYGLSKLSIFPGFELEKIIKNNNKEILSKKEHEFYNKLYLLTQTQLPPKLIKFIANAKVFIKLQFILKLILIINFYYMKNSVRLKIFIKKNVPIMNEIWIYLKEWRKKFIS